MLRAVALRDALGPVTPAGGLRRSLGPRGRGTSRCRVPRLPCDSLPVSACPPRGHPRSQAPGLCPNPPCRSGLHPRLHGCGGPVGAQTEHAPRGANRRRDPGLRPTGREPRGVCSGPGGCLSGEADSRASGPGSGRPTATPRDRHLGAPAWAPPPRLLKRHETQCFMTALVRKTKRIFQATRIIYTHHHYIYIYFFPLLILTATNVNTSSLGMSRRRHLG